MSRVTKKASSVCTDSPLSMSEVCRKMTLMRQILTSCFGPNGRLKQVHNNVGGHVLTTSTSTPLLQAVSSSEPLLKLITASILNHLSRFSDCGLYTGILCFSLIDHVQKSGLRPSVAIKINKQLLEVCTSFLNQEDCGCKVNVDFNSCQSLVTLARSVISSKPACVLTEGEQQHISTLAVHAFLLTVPCGDTPGSPDRVRLGRTVTVSIEGQFVLDSAVFPGLLVNVPDMQLHPTDSEKTRRGPGPFRLALFTVSLSGDLSEFGEGSLEVHRGAPDPEDLILDELLKLGEQAVTDQVEVFMCQRVIHPVLQHYLRRHGVLVVERLGIALIQPIVQMTGAQAVALYQTPIPPEAYGQVEGCCVRTVGSRKMLHLLPPREPAPAVCTMVLCHRNDTMLNELKAACQRAEHVLRLTLRDPVALLGGGCTETHMAAYIRNKGSTEAARAALSLGVSQSQYLLGLNGFCSSLEAVAVALVHDGETGLVDLSYAHHWSVPQGEAVHSGTVPQGEAVHSGTVPQGEAVHSGTVPQGEAVHSGTVPQGEAVHSGTVPQGEAVHSGTVLQGEAVHSGTVPQGEAVHSGTVLQGEAVHSGTVPQGEAVHSGTVPQGEAVHSGTVPQGEAVHSGTVPQGEAVHSGTVPQGEAVHSGTVPQGEAVHSGTVPQGEAVHSVTVPQGEAVHSGTVPQGEAVHSGTVPQGEALQRGDGYEVPATCGCGLVVRSARPGLVWTPLNTRYPSRPAPLVVGKDTPPQLRVLDSFTAKLNALQVAVEMANLVLDIRYVIQDVN